MNAFELISTTFFYFYTVDNVCYSPDTRFSISCINLDLCEPIQHVLKMADTPIDPITRTLLLSYQCGFDKDTIKVWCPPSIILTNTNKTKPPNVDNHQNINLLPEECGYIGIGRKIHHGETTEVREYPWMALISYKTRKGSVFLCGGTIINNQYILTAAHCLNSDLELLSVRIGEHNIDTSIDCEAPKENCDYHYQDLPILDAVVHPLFNRSKYANDIALIKVPEINFSITDTLPICLPIKNAQNFDFVKKPKAIVTGWGITEWAVRSPILLQAFMTVIDQDSCQKILQNNSVTISDRQICAVSAKSDTCDGDSGGPLQVPTRFRHDSRMVQHGIISFGSLHCNNYNYPSVFTRVVSYMDWILDTIKP